MAVEISTRQRQAFLDRAGTRPVALVFCFRGPDTDNARWQVRRAAPAGSCLRDALCRQLVIGDGDLPWTAFQIHAYSDAEAALEHAGEAAAAGPLTRIVALRPAPARLCRIIGAIRFVCRRLPAPVRNVDPETLVDFGGINPTRAALAELEAQPAQPVEMLNLLKFRETARYPDGRAGGSGAEAYQRYGRVAATTVFRLGGSLPFIGRYLTVLAGADGEDEAWDEVALMRYPQPAAFLHMIHNRRYCEALAHRDAGLADTVLIASTPASG